MLFWEKSSNYGIFQAMFDCWRFPVFQLESPHFCCKKQRRLQSAQRDVHVLAQRLARLVELHDTTARVMLAVPDDFVTRSLVQDQSWTRNITGT